MEVELTDRASALSRRLAGRYPKIELCQPTSGQCIYKVPRQLADVNRKAYEPEMVSIGPFHLKKPELEEKEEYKFSYVRSLLQRKREVPFESYFLAIAEVEDEARKCYGEAISLNSGEFIEMLVLDGCFILEFLRQPGVGEHTYVSSRLRNSLHRDLLLLENQIPFIVLRTLFDLIEGENQLQPLMEKFCRKIFPIDVTLKKVSNFEEVKHILDFVHDCLCWRSNSSVVIGIRSERPDIETSHHDSALSIPTATELRDSNVKFKRIDGRYTLFSTFFDVEFERKFGMFQSAQMLMPTLVIEHATESLLRNLIAFEQYYTNGKPTPVTDYALLLDCLINSAEDVQILSRHGIIENKLGSNEMVADFVNKLTLNIIYSNHNFQYAEIFRHVNAHYIDPWNKNVVVSLNRNMVESLNRNVVVPVGVGWERAVVEFKQKYFSSPWAFISLLAASVLLVLTVAQTVFAALEYYQRN